MKTSPRKLNSTAQPNTLSPFASTACAGFPSPADDFVETPLDIHDYLVKHPAATFFARAEGDSMTGFGIFNGDLLIVDRALQAQHGDVVIAAIDGELTCKVLDLHNQLLRAGNRRYPPIELHDNADLLIEGVVIHSVRHHRCSRW
ncbi:MAG: translesion error-prone DNA polymerase V autoproteolytic subunit [Porticoccaceae bacterium]